MYSERELNKAKSMSGAISGAACSQSVNNQIGPRDVSPIEQQLYRQIGLLDDLQAVANELIDSIKPVMRYDPREAPKTDSAEKLVGSSCAMEKEIELRNEMLADKIRLLRQVREVICL